MRFKVEKVKAQIRLQHRKKNEGLYLAGGDFSKSL